LANGHSEAAETVTHEAIRIAVLSASARLRDATAALLSGSPDLEFIGAVATTAELGHFVLAPDAVVFDEAHNEAVESLLLAVPPAIPLVILSDPLDHDIAVRTLRLGGVAILDRDPSPQDFRAALNAALAGLCTLSSAHLAELTDPVGNMPLSAEWIEPLTPRELQILRMLSEARANRAIAAQLEISEHTAKFHVGQILAKLNAQSRTEAVTIGIRRGLIMV
jgi:two-component system, NarL family, response regulator YdfI